MHEQYIVPGIAVCQETGQLFQQSPVASLGDEVKDPPSSAVGKSDTTPLMPPGVFLTSTPHASLPDIDCSLADVAYGEEYGHWDWWQWQNSTAWETTSETCSNAGLSTPGSSSSGSS